MGNQLKTGLSLVRKFRDDGGVRTPGDLHISQLTPHVRKMFARNYGLELFSFLERADGLSLSTKFMKNY